MRSIAIAVALTFAVAASLHGEDNAAKLPTTEPVPDAASLKNASALVEQVYSDDLKSAKSLEGKTALVKKLLDAAKGEQNAGRYALLIKARDLSVATGDVVLCDATLDGIEASFDVDHLKLRADAYTAIARNVRLPADCKTLSKDVSNEVKAALVANQFAIAKSDASLEAGVARSAGDAAQVKQAEADAEAVREIEAEYADVKKAQLILVDKPSEPEANLKVGRYFCFMQGDWEKGLPMLALGSDPSLEALAVQEMAANTADEQTKVGDAWWDKAQKATGLAKTNMQTHAAKLYNAALPQLSGLAKAKVDKRLAELKHGSDIHRTPANIAELWGVRCCSGSTWTDFPLQKMAVQVQDGVLAAKNTSGVGAFARLIYRPLVFNGDFSISFDYRGHIKAIILSPIKGDDRAVGITTGPGDNEWHTIVFQRSEGKMSGLCDGKAARTIRASDADDGLVGYFCISISSDESVEIRNFEASAEKK